MNARNISKKVLNSAWNVPVALIGRGMDLVSTYVGIEYANCIESNPHYAEHIDNFETGLGLYLAEMNYNKILFILTALGLDVIADRKGWNQWVNIPLHLLVTYPAIRDTINNIETILNG